MYSEMNYFSGSKKTQLDLVILSKSLNTINARPIGCRSRSVPRWKERRRRTGRRVPQKHFLCTMKGPDSSYSCLEIHICWNVLRLARIEPPIHTEYFLSGGAIILIFMVAGASAVISFCMRSAMPGYIVVPPDNTELAYRSLRMSTSHFMIELYVVS